MKTVTIISILILLISAATANCEPPDYRVKLSILDESGNRPLIVPVPASHEVGDNGG